MNLMLRATLQIIDKTSPDSKTNLPNNRSVESFPGIGKIFDNFSRNGNTASVLL
jgi:hypothetical protein